MIRFRSVILLILSLFIINGCSSILEPISLGEFGKKITNKGIQEEFSINTRALTFKSALKANKYPYPRHVMLDGVGVQADLVNENSLLDLAIQNKFEKEDYVLGEGDTLSFFKFNEFIEPTLQWPEFVQEFEYTLGPGDQLSFIQTSGVPNSGKINKNNLLISEPLVVSEGIIGTNGNVLLLGVGNIKTSGKTLEQLRTTVRNILIRNGITPNFQLEISVFKSKKAYLINNLDDKNTLNTTLPLTNIPIELEDIALSNGITATEEKRTLIKFIRDQKTYTFTPKQLFDNNSPSIIIKSNDIIKFSTHTEKFLVEEAYIGSRGKVFLAGVGSLVAANRTLVDVQNEIDTILIKKGLATNFQLELKDAKSRKVYLITQTGESKVIPLSTSKLHLKELILNETLDFIPNTISIITLFRDNKEYKITLKKLLNAKSPPIWLHDLDQIEISNFEYKDGQVFVLSGFGKAKIVKIKPSVRETLADVLFVDNGPLSNSLAQRSEIYLLRGRKPTEAYHLDAQNVSRIMVAAQTELRPNDIVFVADRPIVSFTRLLGEISPLRSLLRDLENGNIP